MTAQKLPFRVSYHDGHRRNIYYTRESTARHEAARFARRGFTAVFAALNRNDKYIDKETYPATVPVQAR